MSWKYNVPAPTLPLNISNLHILCEKGKKVCGAKLRSLPFVWKHASQKSALTGGIQDQEQRGTNSAWVSGEKLLPGSQQVQHKYTVSASSSPSARLLLLAPCQPVPASSAGDV
eukprot:752372-Hanusia_phi.AAC.1